MRRRPVSVIVILTVAWTPFAVPPASATDHVLSSAKLTLRDTGTRQRLTFVSKDTTLPFPAIGSADDPSTGGAIVELFSSIDPSPSPLTAPPGVGKPGWTVRDATVDRYTFRNGAAPDAFSPLRTVVLKEGKTLRIVAASTGLDLSTLHKARSGSA